MNNESDRTRELQKAMSTGNLPCMPGFQARPLSRMSHHKPQRFTVERFGRLERDFPTIASHGGDQELPSKEKLLQQWHVIAEQEKLRQYAEKQKLGDLVVSPINKKSISKTASVDTLRVPPSWLKHNRDVLRFFMYFQEPVFESSAESYRVRKCVAYFHLEDGSIAVNEPKENNSGISQGSFLKRSVIKKEDGTPFCPEDFLVGNEVTIHGRTFRVVDADVKTRNFFAQRGLLLAEAEPYPEDPHRRKLRLTAEAALLKTNGGLNASPKTSKKESVGSFLKNDQTLKFSALWDDTGRLYGQKNFYTLCFFLADETVEIRKVGPGNQGDDSFPILLKRSRLPVDPSNPELGFIRAEDLVCGQVVNCWGRPLMLLRCNDPFTSNYYERVHSFKQPVVQIKEPPKQIIKKVIPPYNGFGSEADSLANCLNLIPKPVSQDLHRFLNNRGKTLRFKAKFVTAGPEDEERRFLITYFMDDDTCAVYEPPRRNSGILGGKFLERGRYKKPITAKVRATSDLKALKDTILDKIQSRMVGGPYVLLRAFRKFGTDENGCITFENFKIGLRSIGILPTAFSDEQLERLFRLYDKSGDMKIDYQEFVDHVMQDKPIATNETRFTSRWLRSSDFFVGAVIRFVFPQTGAMTQEFEITSADKATIDLMQDHPNDFPKSNVEAIASMLAETLTENHVNVGEAFRAIDRDGKGWIYPEEFGQLLRSWALDFSLIAEDLTEHEMLTLVRHYDRDSDGRIYYDEFANALKKKKPLDSVHRDTGITVETATAVLFEKLQLLKDVEIMEKFKEIDEDKSGKISWEEFQLMLRRFDIFLNSEKDKAFLMLKFDKNGDGLIDYREFCDSLFQVDFVKEDGQIRKKLIPRDPMYLLQASTQDQGERETEKMLEYKSLLLSAQKNQSEEVLLKDMMNKFCAHFLARRKLLQKKFTSFDIDDTGFVLQREFLEALQRTNPDYHARERLALAAYLFPSQEAELEYHKFLEIFFAQDISTAWHTYGHLTSPDDEE